MTQPTSIPQPVRNHDQDVLDWDQVEPRRTPATRDLLGLSPADRAALGMQPAAPAAAPAVPTMTTDAAAALAEALQRGAASLPEGARRKRGRK